MNTNRPLFRNPDLPVERRVEDLVSRLTLAEKIRQTAQYQDAVPRLGVAAYKHGTEAAHGVAWLGPATTFPQPTGLASTWDRALLERVGTVIGTEARGFYARDPKINGLTLWAPTVDLERDPRWGRTEEAYGEDPFLAGHLAGSLVKGVQGADPTHLRAVCTLKHFWGNNHEEGRGTDSTNAPEDQQRDYYLRSFEIAFRQYGAQSMMTAYNAVNGVPCNLNPQVNQVVRAEWGWKGFVVSDAGDVTGTVREHAYLPTVAEAVAASLKAGIDSITDEAAVVHQAVEEALARGLLSEADLDTALARTFRVRFLLGEFDDTGPYHGIGPEVIGLPAHAALSREAAAKSFVLLHNDGLLPLKTPRSLAVVGPLADSVFRDWYSGSLPYAVSPLAGLRERFPDAATASGCDHVALPWGECEVTNWGWGSFTIRRLSDGKWLTETEKGVEVASEEVFGWFTKEVFGVHPGENGRAGLSTWDAKPAGTVDWTITQDGITKAVEAARAAETAVVVVGTHPLVTAKETIDRPDIVLPPAQEALVKAVTGANPNTVVVVVSGYPLSSPSNYGRARAVLTVSHAGQELGRALADVLTGDVNPAGRLPLTWYRSVNDLPPLKDYDLAKGRTYRYFTGSVQFPFGHGLSYTVFAYEALEVNGNQVSFTLTNKGHRGEEVVQLYLRALPGQPGPRLRLAAFDRVPLNAGESRRVTLTIDSAERCVWNAEKQRPEPGQYEVCVGASSADVRLVGRF